MNNGHALAAGNPLVGLEPDDELVRDSRLVLVVAPDLPAGMAANRCAVLATGIAARHPEIIGHDQVTVDGVHLSGFTKVPIAVLVARDLESLKTLADQARARGCSTLVYLSRAQACVRTRRIWRRWQPRPRRISISTRWACSARAKRSRA
jgi:hypothetical protein